MFVILLAGSLHTTRTIWRYHANNPQKNAWVVKKILTLLRGSVQSPSLERYSDLAQSVEQAAVNLLQPSREIVIEKVGEFRETFAIKRMVILSQAS
jgi:hypothetical protein